MTGGARMFICKDVCKHKFISNNKKTLSKINFVSSCITPLHRALFCFVVIQCYSIPAMRNVFKYFFYLLTFCGFLSFCGNSITLHS